MGQAQAEAGQVTFPMIFVWNVDAYRMLPLRRWNPLRDSHHRSRDGVISARLRSLFHERTQ